MVKTMNWLEKWLNKFIILKRIDVINLKPDQLLVFYMKGLKTRRELENVQNIFDPLLRKLKVNFLICPVESISKIDVVEKEDVKPNGTIQYHPAILL
jgi:hypothetical protein